MESQAPQPTSLFKNFTKCGDVEKYTRISTISEGVYGVVHKSVCKKTNEIVALKKIKIHKTKSGFPIHSLREIKLLLECKHNNIIKVKEIVTACNGDVFMVMEYAFNDLQNLMQNDNYRVRWTIPQTKCLMKQLLSGVAYLHSMFILHRDLKTANLLLTNNGVLKICDLGMAREYGIPLQPYTNLVVTLWYRAPELLLGSKLYGPPIDIWSIGCIFAELLTGQVLFRGEGEFKQIDSIFSLLGTPNDDIWDKYSTFPHSQRFKWRVYSNKLAQKFPVNTPLKIYYRKSKKPENTNDNHNNENHEKNEKFELTEKFEKNEKIEKVEKIEKNEKEEKDENGNIIEIEEKGPILTQNGFDLLRQLLIYDPLKRITAQTACEHAWFKEDPITATCDEMPSFPDIDSSIHSENRPSVNDISQELSC